MPPRAYHLDRASTPAERQRRFRERHNPQPASLKRIGDAPLTRQQWFNGAALQRSPQFDDAWGVKGEKGQIARQHEREDVDWGRQYDGYGPQEFPADNIWIPTRRSYVRKGFTAKLLFKDGKYRSVPIAPGGPERLILVTPELERLYLAALALLEARDKRRTRR